MKESMLTVQEGAKFSPAAVFLGQLLRNLKSSYETKPDFIRHMSKRIEDKQFTKSEVLRLWDALHNITYYYNGAEHPGMDQSHHLTFVRPMYAGFSVFFERYAQELLEYGNIVQHRGRKKGYHIIRETVQETPIEETIEEPTIEEVVETLVEEPSQTEELILIGKLLSDYTTEELVQELSRRGYIVNLCYNK